MDWIDQAGLEAVKTGKKFGRTTASYLWTCSRPGRLKNKHPKLVHQSACMAPDWSSTIRWYLNLINGEGTDVSAVYREKKKVPQHSDKQRHACRRPLWPNFLCVCLTFSTHPHMHTCVYKNPLRTFPDITYVLPEKIGHDCLHDWGHSYFWNIWASEWPAQVFFSYFFFFCMLFPFL